MHVSRAARVLTVYISKATNIFTAHVSGAAKDGGTLTADKYFDNLITLIEEASSSLEI